MIEWRERGKKDTGKKVLAWLVLNVILNKKKKRKFKLQLKHIDALTKLTLDLSKTFFVTLARNVCVYVTCVTCHITMIFNFFSI